MARTNSSSYILALAVIFIAILSISGCKRLVSTDTVTITVTDKERVVKSESSYYLVYTDDEVFKNVDDLMWGKYSSSDLQGKLRLDTTYKVTVDGWRVPFLSMYRNIIKINE